MQWINREWYVFANPFSKRMWERRNDNFFIKRAAQFCIILHHYASFCISLHQPASDCINFI